MKSFKYIAVLILYSFMLVLDFFFVLVTIAVAFGKKDPNVSDVAQACATVVCSVLSAFLIFLTLKIRSYSKKLDKPKYNASKCSNKLNNDDDERPDEPIWTLDGQNQTELKPNFEIKYKSAEGEVTVRKVFAKDFDGKMLDAYCFLRDDDRTFYVPRIIECVDLATGEVLSNDKGDLRWYFNERFKKDFKPSDMFEYDEWVKMSFSSCAQLVDDISGFDVDDYFVMKIATYKDGVVSGRFHCGKVYSSMYDGFYIAVTGEDGCSYNVEPNKVISVEGVEDIVKYINDKYLSSNECKARRLQKECESEISVLVYLCRADGSSLNEKKRTVICNYLKNTGRECTTEILAIVARRISVDTNDFKKIVNALSKMLGASSRPLLLATANEIVGGKEKAKPFGLAGLQYIESKIKV